MQAIRRSEGARLWRTSVACSLAVHTDKTKMPDPIAVGSTNVYSDLDYSDAEEMPRKPSLVAKLGHNVAIVDVEIK